MSETTIHLVSSEGDSFALPLVAAKLSELVKTMLDEEAEEADGAQEVPLPNVKSKTLARVVDYLNHQITTPMKEIQKPLKTNKITEVVDEWYASFVSVELDQLFELILAANYMDIKPLLELLCAAVACQVKGKAPDDIRKTFNITDDFTAEELLQVREENKWCEDA